MDDLQRGASGLLTQAYVELVGGAQALCTAASQCDWSLVEARWPSFVRMLEERCAFEEEVLFPAYAEQGLAARALVRRLVEEHAAIHQLVVATGEQIQHRRMRPVTQELLCDVLRDHAVVESAELEPWIALDGRDWSLQLRRIPTLP